MCLGVCLLALAGWNWSGEGFKDSLPVKVLCADTQLSFYQFTVPANASYVVQVQTWNPPLATSDACAQGTAEFTTPYSVTLLDDCFVQIPGSPGCRSRDSGR